MCGKGFTRYHKNVWAALNEQLPRPPQPSRQPTRMVQLKRTHLEQDAVLPQAPLCAEDALAVAYQHQLFEGLTADAP